MADSLLSNYYVLEKVVELLTVSDLVSLCSVGREWRGVVGSETVWSRVARREGVRRDTEYLVKEYEEYAIEAKKTGLSPLCRSFFKTVYPAFIRKKWRHGLRRARYMNVPQEIRKDVIVCYDVCPEFLVLGTAFGKILICERADLIQDFDDIVI